MLIKGACIVSLDANVGDFDCADIRVTGKKIEEVGENLTARPDEEIIDGTGMIAFPGFVDTHRHSWQNAFRRYLTACDFNSYGKFVNALSAEITPEDVHIATMAAAVDSIDCGITTLLDWSHISNTPEHSDAAINGLKDSRIRGMYAYAYSRAGGEQSKYPEDIHRIMKEHFSSTDGRMSICLGANIDRTFEWKYAREYGIGISAHLLARDDLVKEAYDAGLMGPDVTYIHCTNLSDESWKMIADTGGTVSIATPSVAVIGLAAGIPAIQKSLDNGIRPSLSVDVEVSLPGDMFSLMQLTYCTQRMHAHEEAFNGNQPPEFITARDVLEFATIQGARAIGEGDRIGSLTPGKDADIVLLDTRFIGTSPVNDPVGTIVMGASVRNVDTVLIQGEVVKRSGRLVGQDKDKIITDITNSRDALADKLGLRDISRLC